jgi:AcrR family transcriptional regulator
MTVERANPNRRATSLSREQVARAALEMVDRDGIDALSMRRLANELGVGTMTLYGYFRGKPELLDALLDVAAEDFEAPAATGPFREQVIAYCVAARTWLLRHPAIVKLRGESTIVRPSAFAVSEGLMRLLADAGLPPEDRARAFRVLFTYLFGSALVSPTDPDAATKRAVHAALLTLPEEDFPALRSAAPHAGDALGGERQYVYGLELILDGIESRLRS